MINFKLLEIYRRCFPYKSESVLKANLEAGYDIIVEGLADDPIGFVLYRGLVDGEVEIIDIAVDPSHQNQGYGAKLINKIDAKKIFLEVSENNLPAVHLYKKLGFEVISIRKNYYKIGVENHNALIMLKII